MLAGIATVLFDLDGTLTVPVLDFAAIRRRLDLPEGTSIVHALAELPPEVRRPKEDLMRQMELEAARAARPNQGACELVRALQQRGMGVAIITRNFAQAVALTLKALELEVPVVITRDDAEPKPSPEPLKLAMARLGASAESTLMVGDFLDDMDAGRAAGVATCLVTNGGPPRFEADMHVHTPAELLARFESAWR